MRFEMYIQGDSRILVILKCLLLPQYLSYLIKKGFASLLLTIFWDINEKSEKKKKKKSTR